MVIEGDPAAAERLGAEPLAVVLERLDPANVVSGVVLDPDGEPVAGAWVALGDSVRRANASGSFRFELANDSKARAGTARLLASAEGWSPVEFRPSSSQAHASPTGGESDEVVWPEYVELRFQREAMSIEGTVLDTHGDPAAGHYVWIDDMTPMGSAPNQQPITTEALDGFVYEMHKRYATNAEGRFQIDNLSPRTYTLIAMDPQTLSISPASKFAAGDADAVIQHDAAAPIADLAGRVLSRRGEPVEGAFLSCTRVTIRIGNYGDPASTEPVPAGPDGAFHLSHVPLDPELWLTIHAKGYLPSRAPVTEVGTPHDDLLLTLDAQCEAKVVAGSSGHAAEAASFQLKDATGEVLELSYSPKPGSYYGATSIQLVDGVSFVFQTSEAATEIDFLGSQGEVVSTQSLRLFPGELNEIRRE